MDRGFCQGLLYRSVATTTERSPFMSKNDIRLQMCSHAGVGRITSILLIRTLIRGGGSLANLLTVTQRWAT